MTISHITDSRSADHIQLLTNGKVLFTYGDASARILEPDQFGSYTNRTLRRIADMPYTHLYGAVSVLSNGNVKIQSGEFGTSVSGGASIFNPKTETWTAGTSDGGHQSIPVRDDGTATSVQSTGVYLTETGLAMLPDGRFLVFASNSGNFINILKPIYSSEFVSAGSFNGDGTYENLSMTTQLNALAADWRATAKVFSSSNAAVGYELGPSAWMPKIGKAVLIAGNGWIFTYDVNTNTLLRPAVLPMTGAVGTLTAQSFYLGTVRSANNGQSSAAIQTAGTITISTVGNSYPPANVVTIANTNIPSGYGRNFYILTSGGTKAHGFTFTGITHDSGANTLTFTGVNAAFTGNTDTLTTGDSVSWGRPFYGAQDTPGTFLPNGDFVFAAGAENIPYASRFGSVSRMMKWDGSAAVAVGLETDGRDFGGSSAYYSQLLTLPSGEILNKVGILRALTPPYDYGVIYTPTSAELTPLSGSVPIITYFPTQVDPGGSVMLTGQQLNGIHEGGVFGDDSSARTNFPIVRFKNQQTNHVYFGLTKNFTYRGIQPGRPSQCIVDIPKEIPPGIYDMNVIATGAPSTTQTVRVSDGNLGDAIFVKRYG